MTTKSTKSFRTQAEFDLAFGFKTQDSSPSVLRSFQLSQNPDNRVQVLFDAASRHGQRKSEQKQLARTETGVHHETCQMNVGSYPAASSPDGALVAAHADLSEKLG